jgi:drug/metabolite transporter (DMT)-like permease
VVLLVLGIAGGERIDAVPTAGSVAALLYLTIFGSIIAYTAYVYLLERTRLAMATSYAYVNPAVAVLLGMTLGAEIVTGPIFIALPLIICGVAIITIAQRGRPDVEPEPIPSGDHVDEEGGARVALGE